MTHPQPAPPHHPTGPRSIGPSRNPARRWVPIAAAVVVLIVALGLWMRRSATPEPAVEPAEEAVKVAGPQLIAVQPNSPLANKLDVRTVTAEHISTPLLTVTGSVVARLAPGKDSPDARWDFSHLELATAYADWLRARAEEPYAEQQLAKTRELAAARIAAQTKVVERLRQLVKVGTDAPRDLAKEEADLVQAQLEGQKQTFEAELALKNAVQARAALQRQLFQSGVDPELLSRAQDGTVIVVADVPETRLGLVRDGQSAVARFFALPGETFSAHVKSQAPALVSERRTLRVFFELDDPQAHLRPGMFADVGLGTEPREALLVPSDAILHVGGSDYVLAQTDGGLWRVAEVQVGETSGTNVEILSGLAPGATIVGAGAILLKPLVVQALHG
jgi:RND family efflux transporter MFP subunit